VVVAGPGTGKTRVLSYRIAYLIETGQARPSQILDITFTNKACREISRRVSGLLKDRKGPVPEIKTFHGWAAAFIRRLNGPERFLMDERDSKELLGSATRDLKIRGLGKRNCTRWSPGSSRSGQFSHWKTSLSAGYGGRIQRRMRGVGL